MIPVARPGQLEHGVENAWRPTPDARRPPPPGADSSNVVRPGPRGDNPQACEVAVAGWPATGASYEDVDVTFLDRLDPDLRPMLDQLVANDLSADIVATRPAARRLAEQQWAMVPE